MRHDGYCSLFLFLILIFIYIQIGRGCGPPRLVDLGANSFSSPRLIPAAVCSRSHRPPAAAVTVGRHPSLAPPHNRALSSLGERSSCRHYASNHSPHWVPPALHQLRPCLPSPPNHHIAAPSGQSPLLLPLESQRAISAGRVRRYAKDPPPLLPARAAMVKLVASGRPFDQSKAGSRASTPKGRGHVVGASGWAREGLEADPVDRPRDLTCGTHGDGGWASFASRSVWGRCRRTCVHVEEAADLRAL